MALRGGGIVLMDNVRACYTLDLLELHCYMGQ